MHALLLAHGGFTHLLEGFGKFGADWLKLVPLLVAALAGAAVLARRGRSPNLVVRLGEGAATTLGLPSWVALPVATVLGVVLPFAALGFYWDVAWHIDRGRDEFLFSPPHVALLVGLAGLGVAGALSVFLATREHAPNLWRVGRFHVPFGASALLVAGAMSQVGWLFDELWHWAYGLDVTMWGPTHLTMISAAAFSPLAVWLLLAQAGPGALDTPWGRRLRLACASITIISLSAWQLEFDLGVPQWQALYHPVLVAFVAGLGFTLARVVLGRGGALLAAAGSVAVRGVLALTTVSFGLTLPHFPLYLATAVAIEAVLWRPRSGSFSLRHGLAAGTVAGTIGLAGAAVWTQIFSTHPWSTTMLPGIWVAVVVAVGASVLGTAAGNVLTHRPAGVKAGAVVLAFATLAVGVVAPFPRREPQGSALVRTSAAGPGQVAVEVTLDPPGLAGEVDRFEVFSWQGGGSERIPLEPTAVAGTYRSTRPSPVGGTWKTIVRYASRDRLGAIPVFLPSDPAIGASEVPVVPERRSEFLADAPMLQREAHDGPAWPGIVAYAWVALALGALVGVLVAGFVALDRRRRAALWWTPAAGGVLAGHQVVVVGASG